MDAKKPFRTTLRGKSFIVTFRKMVREWGLCEPGRIYLDPRMDEDTLTEITIHEGIHACLPDLDEETVDATAADVAKLLKKVQARLNVE